MVPLRGVSCCTALCGGAPNKQKYFVISSVWERKLSHQNRISWTPPFNYEQYSTLTPSPTHTHIRYTESSMLKKDQNIYDIYTNCRSCCLCWTCYLSFFLKENSNSRYLSWAPWAASQKKTWWPGPDGG